MKISATSTPQEVKTEIQLRYKSGGHSKGWSYIYGQLASREAPELVTIGLNPGGGRDDDLDCHLDDDLSQDASPDVINSYANQPWARGANFTPLQVQIQRLKNTHFPLVKWSKVLSFQFVPFRSPSWIEMPRESYADAIELGSNLLDWTLAKIDEPKLVVGFGLSSVADGIIDWFEATHVNSISTGWGQTKAQVYSSPKARRLVLLPHLSRYRVLGRTQFERESEVFNPAKSG